MNRFVGFDFLFQGEMAMTSAGNRQQLVLHPGFGQSFVQAHPLRVRHQRIGISVNGEHRRQSSSHISQRGEAFSQLFAIGQAAQP